MTTPLDAPEAEYRAARAACDAASDAYLAARAAYVAARDAHRAAAASSSESCQITMRWHREALAPPAACAKGHPHQRTHTMTDETIARAQLPSHTTYEPTFYFRWSKAGVLQQAWNCAHYENEKRVGVDQEWRNVPHEQ